MTVMHTEAERLAMIREALERLTAAATGLFEDWQQARSFLCLLYTSDAADEP